MNCLVLLSLLVRLALSLDVQSKSDVLNFVGKPKSMSDIDFNLFAIQSMKAYAKNVKLGFHRRDYFDRTNLIEMVKSVSTSLGEVNEAIVGRWDKTKDGE